MVASVDLENCTRAKALPMWECFRVSSIDIGGDARVRSRAHARFAREQLTVKIVRAHGGCLGTRRRRRTWTAAISHGEVLNNL